MWRRWAYNGSATTGHGMRRVEATEAPRSRKTPRPSSGRIAATPIEGAVSTGAKKDAGAVSSSSVCGAISTGVLRLGLARVRRRTGGSSRRIRRAEPSGRLRGRAAAGADCFAATAFAGCGGGVRGAAGGCTVVVIGRRAARSTGGGGGGGGGIGRARCFGRAGLGSGLGAGCGSGSGGGGGGCCCARVVAPVVGAVGLWRGEAWPASAPEVANPSMQRPARTSVANPTERGRDGAASAPRLIESACPHLGPSARDR